MWFSTFLVRNETTVLNRGVFSTFFGTKTKVLNFFGTKFEKNNGRDCQSTKYWQIGTKTVMVENALSTVVSFRTKKVLNHIKSPFPTQTPSNSSILTLPTTQTTLTASAAYAGSSSSPKWLQLSDDEDEIPRPPTPIEL